MTHNLNYCVAGVLLHEGETILATRTKPQSKTAVYWLIY